MTCSSRSHLVIFDCDGVLVDSEPTSNCVLAAVIAEAGPELEPDEVGRRFEGMRLADIQTNVEEQIGRPLGGKWLGDFERRREAMFRKGLDAVPGIESVLRALSAAGQPICVASQARREKTELTLGLAGLRDHFADSALFSSTMVERGKPHPDLFLHAARTKGFEPWQCVVVEDGVSGVHAARAAGMQALGYAPGGNDDRLNRAGARVFGSMAELPGLLREATA
jgi:HAD superfamily hydrolase (TIGR01509 family)